MPQLPDPDAAPLPNRHDPVTVTRGELDDLVAIARGAAEQAKDPAAILEVVEPVEQKYDVTDPRDHAVIVDWGYIVHGRS